MSDHLIHDESIGDEEEDYLFIIVGRLVGVRSALTAQLYVDGLREGVQHNRPEIQEVQIFLEKAMDGGQSRNRREYKDDVVPPLEEGRGELPSGE